MLTKKGKIIRVLFYTVCASAFMEINVSAYIDPATTSYVIQIAAGIVIACGTGIGILISKLRRRLKKKDGNEAAAAVSFSADTEGEVMTAADLLDDGEGKE